MEDPFNPGFWSIRPARPRAAAAPSTVKHARPAKVFSVPVHFINSDEKVPQPSPATTAAAVGKPLARITPMAAALVIQRVFRGFLVRKNLQAVRRLEAEVEAVEREVERAGDRLRLDARERLRVSESLMSLLFRLDSVRGVRDYRRRVIRRAIALQEAVDAIAAGEEADEGAAAPGNDVGDAPGETLDEPAPTTVEIPRSTDSGLEALEDNAEAPSSGDEDGGKKADEEDSADGGKESDEEDSVEDAKQEEGEGAEADTTEETLEALGVESASDEGSGAVAVGEASEDRDGEQLGDVIQDDGSEEAKSSAQALGVAEEGKAGRGCEESMRQVMERMVEESQGLKGLVAELCERNEVQLRLMEGLLQRVERLEKVVEKMGKKKKRRAAADAKKCCPRK